MQQKIRKTKSPNRSGYTEAEVLKFAADNPHLTYAQIGLKYNISASTIAGWKCKAKKKDPSIQAKPPNRGSAVEPVEGDVRLTGLQDMGEDMLKTAQRAIRLRLQRLADVDVIMAENPKDLRQGMRDIIECFSVLRDDVKKGVEQGYDPTAPVNMAEVSQDLAALPEHVREQILSGK